jgi:hypothetical protein
MRSSSDRMAGRLRARIESHARQGITRETMKTIIAAVLAAASLNAHAVIYSPPDEKCPDGVIWSDGMRSCRHLDEERQRAKISEANERYASKRIQSIPGICTGDDCNHVVKIQHWDARTGAMLN